MLLVGAALLGAPVFLVVLLVLVLGGGATPPPSPCAPGGSSPGVGALRVAGIPANYVPLVQKAGTVSPEFPAPVIAAQLSQESNFSDQTSSTGAQGPAQFMPDTWATWGKDTTGKGYADVHNPSDAVDAQARFDAALVGQVKAAQAAGQIHSSASVTEMALGAYNAGFGAVLASGGIPQNSQTMAYVPRIMALARTTFSVAATIPAPGATPPPPAAAGGTGTQADAGCGGVGGQVAAVSAVSGVSGSAAAQTVIAAAKTQLGLPYVWGGGDANGPTGGGFDCSGLTLFAFKKVGVSLPRVAEDQYTATAATRLPGGYTPGAYQAGDLLFWGTPGNIHHVAIAMGNGQMIHASTFGQPLAVAPIYQEDFFAATRPLAATGAPQ